MVTELDRRALIRLDQLPEECSPLHEGMPAQILAIEVQEIEGKEQDSMRCRVNGRAKGMKVR